MKKKAVEFLAGALAMAVALSAGAANGGAELMLKDGWAIRSAAEVSAKGDALSAAGYDAKGWLSATVPSTVLAALVADGKYPDPYFGTNLKSVPGSWPFPLDISSFPMPPFSPFRKSWWYRAEFTVPTEFAGKSVWLHFKGINYSADVWLNGQKIADEKEVAGPFRYFDFEVSSLVRPGETNALAIEVYPPTKYDLAFTWVDWNPAPPDRDMGVWREVYLTADGPVSLRYPAVVTDLDLPSLKTAHLTVVAEAVNATGKTVRGRLTGRIEGIEFGQEVELAPLESREIVFSPDQFADLNLKNPRVWWPAKLGKQELYDLDLSVSVDGEVSDHKAIKFGIRKISSALSDEDNLIFQINGKNILIRGAGWAPDMMLRWTPERLAAEIRYVKEMNLNAIRLEGKLETDLFYDICDREGILVLAGWCCCHHWERWQTWDAEDYAVAEASEKNQLKRLRSHPSLAAWLNGSDRHPPANVETMYLRVIEQCRWPNPVISSATEAPSTVSGKSGVKMNGPYEWVPPAYWYEDDKRGGAWGFNTETSPGPAPPPLDSLRQMLPPDKLWPINEAWDYHAGRGVFDNLDVFTKALDARYGRADSAADYAMKAQAMTYEAERAMFEAYGRNKYHATGVIQWMLNTAWPGTIWHLYDYFLRPGGGFYGTMRACEPLHVQYSYDDHSIVVVNSFYRAFPGLKVAARIYNLDMSEKFAKEETMDAAEDSSTRVFTLPKIEGLSRPYFLKLDLHDAGKLVSANFYWLSPQTDELNWARSTWYYTPQKTYADFTGLADLPKAALEVTPRYEQAGEEGTARVSVRNPTPNLAFMVRFKVTKPDGEEILPVYWNDNYISLMPGEEREITAGYSVRDLGEAAPGLMVEGWNVHTKTY